MSNSCDCEMVSSCRRGLIGPGLGPGSRLGSLTGPRGRPGSVLPGRILLPSLSFNPHIKANWIDNHARLIEIPHSTLKAKLFTVRVHAVAEKHDRLALLDWPQGIERQLHCVVQPRTESRKGFRDCNAQGVNCSAPSALSLSITRNPALTHGATKCRRFAAGLGS